MSKPSIEHSWRSFAGLVPAVALVGGLSTAALLGVVTTSLRPGSLVGGSYGTDAWRRLLADSGFHDAVFFTLRTALLSTAISVALALPLAMALRRSRGLARSLIAAPIPIPHLVYASVAVLWLGPAGIADRLGGSIPIVASPFGWGVIAVYVIKETPFLCVVMLAALGGEDHMREDAARTLGASRWDRWRGVLLPQLARPTVLASGIVTAFVVGSTEVPLLVGPLLPDALTTWSLTIVRLRGPVARPDAAAALVVTSLLALLLVLAMLRLGDRILTRGRQRQ